MSISWGRRQRFRFHAAGELTELKMPAQMAAVFAITYKRDPANRPKAHTVLYFGESSDVSHDLQQQCRNIRELWHNRGGGDTKLYLFYHAMPSSTATDRSFVQGQLVAEYDPLMNNEN